MKQKIKIISIMPLLVLCVLLSAHGAKNKRVLNQFNQPNSYNGVGILVSETPASETAVNDTVNIEKDLTALGYSANAAGNGATDDAAAIGWASNYCATHQKVLFFPGKDTFLVKSMQQMRSNMTWITSGAGAVIKSDATFSGSKEMFQGNGISHVHIRGLQFTNGNSKLVKAVLSFNSFPNLNTDIEIVKCRFFNIWARQAINFGGSGAGESHFNDQVLIESCQFINLYNPAYQIITNDTDPQCDAINLQQTTLRCEVKNNYFYHLSGVGVFGWGWSQTNDSITPNLLYGNWNIHHNKFIRTRMAVEVDGNHLGRGLHVHHNNIFDWTHEGGFAISIASFDGKEDHDTMTGFDRSALELRGIQCDYGTADLVTISPYNKATGGTPESAPKHQINGVEFYGFKNALHGTIHLNRTGTLDANTPSLYNGVALVKKHTEATGMQPESWDELTDPGDVVMSDLIITGYNGHAVYAEVLPNVWRNVNITSSCKFTSNRATENTVLIYGYDWKVNCVIDNTGSPDVPESNGTPSYGAVNVNANQTDATNSLVSPQIINPRWKLVKAHLYHPAAAATSNAPAPQ